MDIHRKRRRRKEALQVWWLTWPWGLTFAQIQSGAEKLAALLTVVFTLLTENYILPVLITIPL